MAINLEKGQTINLDKETNDLSSITIGLGWKIKKKGFLARLKGGDEYDLDAMCFLLNDKDQIASIGREQFQGSDIIYFNNLRHSSGMIVHSGDNLVGGSGVQDDEQIVVKLTGIPQQYAKILFFVNIYEGIQKKQDFGQVEKAFMRATDARGNEIARFNLAEGEYMNMRTVIFGEVYRHSGGWKFRAIGDGLPTDNLIDMIRTYIDPALLQ